jgi:hypothetical protein
VDDADDANAERADVHAPPEGDEDDDASWALLPDLDLSVCLVDHVRTDTRSQFPPRQCI